MESREKCKTSLSWLVFCLLVLSLPNAFAGSMPKSSYPQAVDNGGGEASSSHDPGHIVQASIAQPAIGSSGGAACSTYAGFICGATASLAPKRLIKQSKDRLETIRGEVGPKGSKEIKEAIKDLNESLFRKAKKDTLWIDVNHLNHKHGEDAFTHVKQSVKKLMELVKKPDEFGLPPNIVVALDKIIIQRKLLKACQILALIGFREAKDVGISEKDKRAVEKNLREASKKMGEGKWDEAVSKFGEAWKKAVTVQDHLADSGPQSVEINAALPRVFSLSQNHPNPFNSSTAVGYGLPKPTHVSLKIYDVTGRLVRTLVNEFQKPGYFKVCWEGTDVLDRKVANGVYFYRMEAGDFVRVRKMVLLR